jgi:hypothetical protein
MIWTLFLVAATTFARPIIQAPQVTPSYSQAYSIFIRGEFAGTEKVSEIQDRNGNLISRSQHEIQVLDGLELKRLAFETTMTLAKDTSTPIAYQLKYTSGASGDFYDVKIKGTQIHRVLSRGGKVSEMDQQAGPDTVVFDFNVYHQYDYLARRYDLKKGGRQVFRNFVPVVGGEIPLALTYLEDADLDYGRGKMPVRTFRIEIVGVMTGAFSVDRGNRLVRLVVRDKDLEVVRQDIAPEQAPVPTPPRPPVW